MLFIHSLRGLPRVLAVSAFSLLLTSHVALAADPATVCEAAKLKAAGKKADCLAKEEAKAILGKPSHPAKCGAAFTLAFAKAEAAAAIAGGACPVTGEAAAIERRIDATHVGTAQLIAGEGRLHDNGDGTITDATTGLMWEQKDENGGLHDKDSVYSWAIATGTWISSVNAEGGTGFAGHNDWRVPTAQELQSIVDYSIPSPGSTIAPIFGPTVAYYYWSSTSDAGLPSYAWYVDFTDGNVNPGGKIATLFVRGVRGGS